MKKVLAYTLVAVLLGVVTMLAPFSLFVSEMDTNEMDTQAEPFYSSPEYTQRMSSKTEQTRGITSATCSPDLLFIAFMLVLSFVTAFGVMRHFMRKTIL
ncbi:MAG: hypothetical protein OEZ35_04905 [Candidatus Bathyarchaeota archaeon]|nr:hypothetical protein [Candidatus Bathyarchaeota archaeon]